MSNTMTRGGKHGCRRPAWFDPAALTVLVSVLAGCATSGPDRAAGSALPGLLDPADGRAALVFYAAGDVDPERLTRLITGGDDLVAHRPVVGHTVGAKVVNVLHVLPQSYGFWRSHYETNPNTGEKEPVAVALSIRTLSGEIVDRAGLSADTARIFRLEDGDMDTIREIDRATLLSDPDLRGRDVLDSVTGITAYRDRYLVERFLNAEAVRFRGDGGCLRDKVAATWPNARLVASTRDCRMERAELMLKDGSRVQMRTASPRLGDVSFTPVHPAGEAAPQLWVSSVMPGSPADRAGLRSPDRVLAIDGDSMPGDSNARAADLPLMLHRLLAGAGESVVFRVQRSDWQGNRTTMEVEVPLDEAQGNRLTLIPATPRALTYPDGRRYSGPIELAAAHQTGGDLPMPAPSDGTGQLLTGEGGYLGQFRDGRPDGHGYCFDARGRGAPCRFDAGQQLHTEGAPERSREEILADTGGLSGRAAIDLLRQRMVDALYQERWQDYLARVVDLRVLGVDTGLESIYYEAVALSEQGLPEAAFDRVAAYVNLAGNSGAAYADALALYDELQPLAARMREKREREQDKARGERRGFCEVRQRAGAPLCGCREFGGSRASEAACRI